MESYVCVPVSIFVTVRKREHRHRQAVRWRSKYGKDLTTSKSLRKGCMEMSTVEASSCSVVTVDGELTGNACPSCSAVICIYAKHAHMDGCGAAGAIEGHVSAAQQHRQRTGERHKTAHGTFACKRNASDSCSGQQHSTKYSSTIASASVAESAATSPTSGAHEDVAAAVWAAVAVVLT